MKITIVIPKISQKGIFLSIILILTACYPFVTLAQQTSSEQAARVVKYWLHLNGQPLGTKIGSRVERVESFRDEQGQTLYHVVYLNPIGFIIVAGDNLVEPIIAFIPKGIIYNPSQDTPLGALINSDVSRRILETRKIMLSAKKIKHSFDQVLQSAKTKWALLDRDVPNVMLKSHVESIDDIRVLPLLQTHWNQGNESGGEYCYNLYTPNHYWAGCTPTAMAQIMRFYQFPTTTIGTQSFVISVDGVQRSDNLRGGNGIGGSYNWSLMDYGPEIPISTHRDAIGALFHDVGISINTSYTPTGSSASTYGLAESLKNVYGYSNSVVYSPDATMIAAQWNSIINSNLDAKYPVVLSIYGSAGGHAILCDGYGYTANTLYHHLNMGWGGSNDAWYNLPNVDESYYGFSIIHSIVYNIYTTGTGEIISGRVTDVDGRPFSGASVTAVRAGGGTYTATTNRYGIYALKKIPSNSTYTINIKLDDYNFNSLKVTTQKSNYWPTGIGNTWGANFNSDTAIPFNIAPILLLLGTENNGTN